MGVTEINERGVVHDGVEYPLDVLIYATGLPVDGDVDVQHDRRPRAAARLSEKWQTEGTKTFLGLHTHGFPNLFIVTGPQGGGGSFNFTDAIDDARRLRRLDADDDARRGSRRRRRAPRGRGRVRRSTAARPTSPPPRCATASRTTTATARRRPAASPTTAAGAGTTLRTRRRRRSSPTSSSPGRADDVRRSGTGCYDQRPIVRSTHGAV